MVRKINNSWYIDITYDGTRHRKKSPDNSKAGAKAYEAMLRGRLARGEPINQQDKQQEECEQRFKDFAWKWFETYVKTNNKASEICRKEHVLRAHLVPFFGETPLDKIESLHIERYKAMKCSGEITNQTINQHLSVLSSCLHTAEDWGILTRVPKIKKLKCPPNKFDFLSPEETERLLAHAEGMWRELILVASKTGLRRGELRGLRWPDINWDNKALTVRYSWCEYGRGLVTPKSNKVRHVPLTDEVYEILLQRKSATGFVFPGEGGGRLSADRLAKEIRKACNKAGIRKITCHVLRHTFDSHLVMKGAPLRAIQELMGHANIKTTERYAHLTPSSLKASIDLLEPSSNPPENFGQYMVNGEKQAVSVYQRK